MMGNQWVLGLHLIFFSFFLVATKYTCLGAQNSTVGCHEQERLALLEFKHSVKDDFNMLSSWVGIDCCSWKGVLCDGATGSVVSLHLRGTYGRFLERRVALPDCLYIEEADYYEEDYYLVGNKLNTCLSTLRHLIRLDLSGNYFQGSRIPKFIGSFKSLRYLNLSDTGFSGIIPHHIGNLSNLKVLDLSSSYSFDQRLTPNDMAWVSGLSSLEHLDLSHVSLFEAENTDMIFYMLPLLTSLSLRDCELGFSYPDLDLRLNSSKILPNIKHLDVSSNFFKGQLPRFFHNMTYLTFLDLSTYNLSLPWNSVLSAIPSLSELHLSDCDLPNAPFPPTYFNSSAHSNIQYLDLSWNSFQGTIPLELMNMTTLRVLDLSSNRLNWSIPFMPNLVKLDVSNNNFEHVDLVGIWRQCHLKELRATGNNFGEEMKSPLTNTSGCSQYALEMLYLFENQLNGSIPESIGRLNNLRILSMCSNSLTGSIKGLERLRSLEVLNLAGNKLTGSIPTFLGKLTKLDLSRNQLSGFIPESLGRVTSLTDMDLSSNKLTGPIPASLGRLTSLIDMDLSSNQLTGPIPASIGRLASLQTFSASSNLLNGTIPVLVGQLSKLEYLDVSNNFLEGVVSEAHFANLSSLSYLDTTSNHKLTFKISHEWTPPFQLETVQLGSCTIQDGFPQWLQTQIKLKTLVLSNATLYGLLPTWFQKMSILYYLDLSHNKLGGSLINLPFYGIIDSLLLQDNLFNGSIPISLCRSTILRLLDVSRNMLSGNIPNCVGNLQKMNKLILSSNGLSGVLPTFLVNISSSLAWLKLDLQQVFGALLECCHSRSNGDRSFL